MELGLIYYMDSWVTYNTFWERNNQNKNKLIAYIDYKAAHCIYFICTLNVS